MNELNDFCLDTENDQKNYNLALWYEKQGHTAAAHTYYLRASERSQDKVLAYKALIRASFCYKKQGSREGTEKVLMESALITLPERPEAYYFLSQRYEKYGDWQNCYIYADLGLQCYERNSIEDIDISEYSGKHLLIYQKMIASWPWGKGKETRELSQLLRDKYYHLMDDQYKTRINENMEKFGLQPTTTNKKVIDCFRFFNEKELLELRFNMLKDYVDKFVILEGTRTQSGLLREELLAKKYIKELGLPEDKFIVLEVKLPGNDEDIENIEDDIAFRSLSGQSNDSYKNSLNARTRERLLLNSLLTITDQFDDKTVFFVSDCDEIIKPENIPYFSDMALANQDCLVKIPLIELEGKANLRAYNAETNAPVCVDNVFFICTTSHFKIATPFQMRFNINNPYPTVYITQDGKRIEECGWHFSWMGDNNRLKLKQKSTSHYADRIDGAVYKDMNSKELEEFIDQWKPSVGGINPWGYKGYVLKEYPVEDLPTQILEHEHLRKFFLLENNFSKIVDMYLSDQKIQSNTVERNNLINVLIKKINAKKYLEIGVSNGQNLAKINCEYKVGVDPDTNSPATFHITSDEFFKNNNEKFDIIFIDGLHHADQVLRDILNSLEVLNDNGYIVCHDMNPVSKEHQLIPARPGIWNGDCWKAFVELRSTRNDLEMYVVNTDHGCGIIKKGKQNAINITEELTYENFDKNRKEWLNIIEVPEFKKIINHEHETLENTYYVFKDSNNYDVSFTIEENIKHNYSSLIKKSLEYAKNGESALPEWILNMEGMSGKKYRSFINKLISLVPDPKYLEVGCWTGSTAVSAMHSNNVDATLIDNFSEDFGDYKQTFFSNLERCKAKNVEFINKNFKNVKYPADKKYNIYFYDGPHSEQDQCEALTIPYDSLDDEFIFICDDWCWDPAVIGTLKGIEKLNLDVLYSIQIKTSNYLTGYDNQNTCQNSDWHNGYYIAVCRKPKNRPIPVIGVPIVNGVHWLKRLINSVDYPVKDFFIINNNGRDQITTELDQLCNINHDYIENIKVCHLPSNIGVSAAWNLIIKSYVMEPYWIICNNDVSFTPGFLEEMVTKSKNVEVGVVHPPSINRDMASYGIGSFECFLLKSGVVEQCGLFDENLYPAYCEDCDYILKMKKNKIKSSFVNSDYYHGDMLDKDYYQQGWGGSRTSNEEGDVLKKKIFDFHMLNKQYLKDVWGDDWEKWDKFADSNYIPCEKENKSYGLSFIKTKYLGF